MDKKLTLAFKTYFENFRKQNPDSQHSAHSFDLVVEDIPSSFRLEIVELQVNVDLKHTVKIICLLFTESTCTKISQI